jgi:hypothetical protein
MPFDSPAYWGSRVYLEVGEVRYRSLKAQAAKPTNVLDVRGQVWMCLDNGKGGNYLFQEHILPRVLNFETETVAYSWISFGLIVIKTERAVQPGKCASQKRLTNLRDGSKVWRREVKEDDLQDIKVEAFRGDHWSFMRW